MLLRRGHQIITFENYETPDIAAVPFVLSHVICDRFSLTPPQYITWLSGKLVLAAMVNLPASLPGNLYYYFLVFISPC